MTRYEDQTGDDLVEITGTDVWNAVKTGAKLSFFVGIVAGVAAMFANKSSAFELGGYFATLILCLVVGTLLYVPLNLGVVATSRRRGFLPGLLRFAHGLVVFVGVAAVVLVIGARLLFAVCKLAA